MFPYIRRRWLSRLDRGAAAWLFLLVAAVGSLGCGGFGGEEPPPEKSPAATEARVSPEPETLLRLHGSNTVGAKLAPALAQAFLEAEGAKDIETVKVADLEVRIIGTLEGARKAIAIAAHGSGTAFTGLGAGKADIGMSSRRIKPEEEEALRDLGDLTSAAGEHPIALDGLAVFVHPNNRVEALTASQIRDIFTCAITDWSEVGGSSGAIKLYARDDKSGTFDTFKELILRGEEICDGARRFEDSEELSRSVSADAAGIGFAGLPFVLGNKDLKVSEGGSTPLRPTPFTVRTEDYLLSRRLYLYTPTAPSNTWVPRFVEFAQSDAGQRVAEKVKFIGQSLDEQETRLPEAPMEQSCRLESYLELTRGAEHLPLHFRFDTASAELDTKANRDLGRLVGLLDTPERRGGEILLIGFADSQGEPASNRELSQRRARIVKQELTAEGLTRTTEGGFGEECPVADNDREDGRARNRRVEVWWRR